MADSSRPAENPTTTTVGYLCEVKLLEQRYDENGQLTTKQIDGNKDDADFSQHALVHHLIFNQKHKLEEAMLEINSPYILQALDAVVEFYPDYPAPFNEPVSIKGPYMILGHYLAELSNYASTTQNGEARMHLILLLGFMEREMGADKRKYDRLIAVGHITFPLLWTICRPGNLLLAERSGQYRLYRLLSVAYGETCNGRYCMLRVSFTEYDGSSSGRCDTAILIWESKQVAETVQVKQVVGVQKDEEMRVYPLEYAGNAHEMLTTLKSRGEKFWGLRGIHVQRYQGVLRSLKTPPMGFFSKDSEESDYVGIFTSKSMEGRIVIDTKTFFAENPYHSPYLYDCSGPRADHEAADGYYHKGTGPKHTHKFWHPEDPILCPPYIHGFSPSLKQWCRFNIDQIGDPKWAENAFDHLIMPPDSKRLIRGLVSAYEFPDTGTKAQHDLKGRGLVMLLHGTPGTGKTLTAESVAEHTKKALVVVSAAHLGITVNEIDRGLSTLLEYAAAWKAIVLIDEADIFLEARSSSGSNRLLQNAVVAVFLHQLEYFAGILFLTSNRADKLDPAIKSRIQLILPFTPPDIASRRALWRQTLKRFPASDIDFDIDEALQVLAPRQMNGREIVGASNMIRTLARGEGGRITREHFKTVVQVLQMRDVDFEPGEPGGDEL